MAVEELYFGANTRTAFAVGQARGVVLLAAGQRGMPCAAYTPQQVKGAVCGSGRADKAPGAGDGRAPARAVRAAAARPRRRRARRRRLPRQPRAAGCGGGAGRTAPEPHDRAAVGRRSPCGAATTSSSSAAGVGYRCAVSARDAAPRSRRRPTRHAPHPPRRARRRARAVRLRAPRRSATSSCCWSASSASGPKVALAVLSGGPPRELVAALAAGDVGRLQAVPGIGKRTAERIVVELREKVAGEPAVERVASVAAPDDPRALARDGAARARLRAAGGRRAARRRCRARRRRS